MRVIARICNDHLVDPLLDLEISLSSSFLLSATMCRDTDNGENPSENSLNDTDSNRDNDYENDNDNDDCFCRIQDRVDQVAVADIRTTIVAEASNRIF